MYKVINVTTGQTRNVELPRYVKLSDDGIWIFCTEDDAECVALSGRRYSIAGREAVEDAPEVVIIKRIDAGEELNDLLRENLSNAKTAEELKAAVLDIYDAILDIYQNGVG